MSESTQETVTALSEIIKGAKLTPEQRRELMKLSRAPVRSGRKVKRKSRTGPAAHCKVGEAVTVAFGDGVMLKLTVVRVGFMKLNLSTLSAEQIENRRKTGVARYATDPRFKSARSKWHQDMKQEMANGAAKPA